MFARRFNALVMVLFTVLLTQPQGGPADERRKPWDKSPSRRGVNQVLARQDGYPHPFRQIDADAAARLMRDRAARQALKLAALESEIIEVINEQRRLHDPPLRELVRNDALMRAARRHARKMAELDILEHNVDYNGDGDLEGPGWRARQEGYDASVGEIIMQRTPDAHDIVAGWMQSERHAEIMFGRYRSIGVGAAREDVGRGHHYYCAVLGTEE